MSVLSLSAAAVVKTVLVVTVAIGISGALLAWRERPEPGAVALAALLVGQCWWSATLLFRIDAVTLEAKVFWANVVWLGLGVIPVAWLLFSLEYTGYSQYVRPRYIVPLSIIPAVTAVLGLTNDFHHLLYVDSVLVEQSGITTLDRTPGVWFWVIAGYTYLLGILGIVPLLEFVTSDFGVFRGQSLALLVGLFAPWVTNGLFLLGALPTAGVDPTPVAFSVSGVAYLGALTRFQLFGTSPTPIRQARRSVFRRMQEGALVLDRHDHVVDMNESAAAVLGTDPDEALGRPVGDVVPEFDSVLGDGRSEGTVFYPERGGRAYDVSVSELVDARGRTTGRIITLHDISDHVRQQQRLEVLNRAFRHNIRTNVQVILGQVDYLSSHNSERKAATARRNALAIQGISEKIRTILDVFEKRRRPTRPVPLADLLEGSVAAVREQYPDVIVNADLGPDDVYVDLLLDEVLRNAVENAAQHNTNPDPRVWIDVEAGGDRVEIGVRDNGPGIDEAELALLEQGTETPLEHGTGFGLALICWGAEIAGGEVTIEEDDPSGLTVTIDVPILAPPDGDEPPREDDARDGAGHGDDPLYPVDR